MVTGPSLPAPSSHPFVQYQRSNDLALIAGRSRYVDGVFGRNTALRRSALERAGGFNPEVRTGDDYWLGAMLLNTGHRIRFTNNPIQSRYETSPWGYLKQQSRWLRNILSIGSRHKRDHELRSAQRTVAISCVLLVSALAGAWHWGLALPADLPSRPHWLAALLAPFYQILDHLARSWRCFAIYRACAIDGKPASLTEVLANIPSVPSRPPLACCTTGTVLPDPGSSGTHPGAVSLSDTEPAQSMVNQPA